MWQLFFLRIRKRKTKLQVAKVTDLLHIYFKGYFDRDSYFKKEVAFVLQKIHYDSFQKLTTERTLKVNTLFATNCYH